MIRLSRMGGEVLAQALWDRGIDPTALHSMENLVNDYLPLGAGFSGFGMPRFSLRRLLMRGRLPLTTDSTLSAC